MPYQVLQVKAWVKPVYVCRSCGVQQAGTQTDITCDTIEGLQRSFDHLPKAHYLPVGWASYGQSFACGRCIT